jgi:hypothetical protein
MSEINSCVYINKTAADNVNFSREIVYLFNKTLYIVLFVCLLMQTLQESENRKVHERKFEHERYMIL